MDSDPVRDDGGIGTHRDDPEWLPLGAFVFVIVALVALAVTPAVLLQRITRASDQVATTILPAYDGLRDLAYALEQRVSSARSLFLTGDARYAARLAEAQTAEAEALRTLESLTPRLGPDATAHLESLRRYVARRDSIEAEVGRAGGGVDRYVEALPEFDVLRDSMLAPLVGLRQELVRVTEAREADEARWAGMQRWISVLLGTVAVLAALLVGWFAWLQRRLTRELRTALDEANHLRVVAERRGEELERVTEGRVRLLRGVTHDVKNPLGAAKGYAEILEKGMKAPVLPEQAPLLRGIQRSVDGALAIIGDLLDLARAESGGLSIECVHAELTSVVREVVEEHRAAAEAAGHVLEEEPPVQPTPVFTDPARVRQVLGNLLSNAVKYTPPPGRITVRTAIVDGDGSMHRGRWARVEVSDTGPGIPPELREAVFDEFTRLDERAGMKGHGLGLAIARRVARLLGGNLTVAESRGPGATFLLWLPWHEERSPAGARDPHAHHSRRGEESGPFAGT